MIRISRLLISSLLLLPSTLPAEVHEVVAKTYYRSFARAHPPLLRIKPGDAVKTKTIDAAGFDYQGTKRHPESGNPLTGPFYIEGAEPGDAIVVVLRKLTMNRNWGYSGYRLGLFALQPDYVETIYPNRYKEDAAIPGRSNVVRWDIDLKQQTVQLREPASSKIKLAFPARPMLGCIGVAAPSEFAPISGISGAYGGNMDYNEVVEGASVILPVYHPGALLYIGDAHALQGDGEATGTGVETSMDVEFSVEIRKQAHLNNPRLETKDYLISVGSQPEFASSLDRALQIATTDMVRWLANDYGIEPWAAHLLVGYQGRYDVVTVAGSMALKISRKHLPAGK
jgi:acetamidase/formamidase